MASPSVINQLGVSQTGNQLLAWANTKPGASDKLPAANRSEAKSVSVKQSDPKPISPDNSYGNKKSISLPLRSLRVKGLPSLVLFQQGSYGIRDGCLSQASRPAVGIFL